MLHIQKNVEPQALAEAKHKGLKKYDDMDSITKDAVKKSLLTEQFHLCAYCMRRIDLESMQIEHYRAQHPQGGEYDPALTIDYRNMLGVCTGGKNAVHGYKQLTCDQHRKNIPLTVDPQSLSSIKEIRYKADGTIYSNNANICKDLCDTLNLNCPESRLKENRKAALDALKRWIQKEYKNQSIPSSALVRIQQQLCGVTAGMKKEYAGILEDYLDRKIKSTK